MIPLIDIGAFDRDEASRVAVARDWDRAFGSVGFCSLVGHGVASELSDRLYHAAHAFFDLPHDLKMRLHDPSAPGSGYIPLCTESVGRAMGNAAQPDVMEAIQFSNLHRGGQPAQAQAAAPIRELWELAAAYAVETAALSRKLMTISALALDLPAEYFARYYAQMTTTLRLVRYPDQIEEPLPGQLRNAAHTDFGGFTLLRQDDAPGGLQVFVDGAWIDVRPVAGAFVVNAGDLIARWTNDRWRSNLHRVVNPPRELTGSTQRLSIVLFTGPEPEAQIACLPTCVGAGAAPRYAPITAAAHTSEKVRLAFGVRVSAAVEG